MARKRYQPEGIVSSRSKGVLAIVITLIIGLATGAFVLSFSALRDLAISSGIPENLAWIWPLIIDGFIVTATVAIFALRSRSINWYPWTALVVFAVVSVLGNAVHAFTIESEITVPLSVAALVSAIPAIALLLASHFLVIMISAPKYATKPSKTTPATPVTASEPLSSPIPAPTSISSFKPSSGVFDANAEVERLNSFSSNQYGVQDNNIEDKPSVSDEELEEWVRERLEVGETISNADLQNYLGCSLRTAQRKKAKLREKFPELDNS
jgi:hypothetical protein